MLCQVPVWLELQEYLKVLTRGRSQCWLKHPGWRPQRPGGGAVVDPPGESALKSGAGIGALQEAQPWMV